MTAPMTDPTASAPQPPDGSWTWWEWLRLGGWVAISVVLAAAAALGITAEASATSGALATAAVARAGRLWLLAALGVIAAPWVVAAYLSRRRRRRLLMAALIATSPLIWTMYQAIDRHWWDGNWLR